MRRTGTFRWRVDSQLSPRTAGPWACYERAPGRAGGLQNRRTGFDSSRSCLDPSDGIVPKDPDGVTERMWTLRRSRSWFESGSGYSRWKRRTCLASVTEALQSSKLRDGVRLLGEVLANKNCLRGVVDAHDSAKVEDQVRFLAGTFLIGATNALRPPRRARAGRT